MNYQEKIQKISILNKISSQVKLEDDIFYIGRGEYWFKNHGRVKLDYVDGKSVFTPVKKK